MKKLTIMAIGLCLCGTAVAQESVLKEAERGLRVEVPDHAKIASMLEGAMTDPSTAENVKTWYLAGKNAFQTWQTGIEQLQVGGNPDILNMCSALLNGFDYYMKALPMDTVVVDPVKNKIKTKYSKEIAKTLETRHGDFNQAAGSFYNAGNFKDAYRCWSIFTTMPSMANRLGKNTPSMPADSVMAETYYNMGYCALQGDMRQEAMESFLKAARLGHGESAYNNALAVAQDLQNVQAMEEIASEAISKFDSQNFIAALVNVYIKGGKYDKALQMLDKAIAANPNNSILYNAKGVLVETRANDDSISKEDAANANVEAQELYGKAAQLDPKNAEAIYNYGRVIANKAYTILDSDEVSKLSAVEYNKIKQETTDPLFKQAAEQLEKVIELDSENYRQAFTILKNIYYNLGDEENMKRISDLELE